MVQENVAGRYALLCSVVTFTLSATGTFSRAREGAIRVTVVILSEEGREREEGRGRERGRREGGGEGRGLRREEPRDEEEWEREEGEEMRR